MTRETEAMSKEDVRIDWEFLAKGVVDHDQMQTSADYGTFWSSGSSSTLDKRKPKKLREWVKEEPKQGEKKKPHPASKARVAELLFLEEKQRAIEIALAQRRSTDGPRGWTKADEEEEEAKENSLLEEVEEEVKLEKMSKEELLAKSCSEKSKAKPPEVLLKPNETFVGPYRFS